MNHTHRDPLSCVRVPLRYLHVIVPRYLNSAVFARAGPFELCRVALELLSGVAYLHAKGMAHRDLVRGGVLNMVVAMMRLES